MIVDVNGRMIIKKTEAIIEKAAITDTMTLIAAILAIQVIICVACSLFEKNFIQLFYIFCANFLFHLRNKLYEDKNRYTIISEQVCAFRFSAVPHSSLKPTDASGHAWQERHWQGYSMAMRPD